MSDDHRWLHFRGVNIHRIWQEKRLRWGGAVMLSLYAKKSRETTKMFCCAAHKNVA